MPTSPAVSLGGGATPNNHRTRFVMQTFRLSLTAGPSGKTSFDHQQPQQGGRQGPPHFVAAQGDRESPSDVLRTISHRYRSAVAQLVGRHASQIAFALGRIGDIQIGLRPQRDCRAGDAVQPSVPVAYCRNRSSGSPSIGPTPVISRSRPRRQFFSLALSATSCMASGDSPPGTSTVGLVIS